VLKSHCGLLREFPQEGTQAPSNAAGFPSERRRVPAQAAARRRTATRAPRRQQETLSYLLPSLSTSESRRTCSLAASASMLRAVLLAPNRPYPFTRARWAKPVSRRVVISFPEIQSASNSTQPHSSGSRPTSSFLDTDQIWAALLVSTSRNQRSYGDRPWT